MLDDHTYTHSSSAGVTAAYDQSSRTWSILEGDACVAHWADSSPSASPESLYRELPHHSRFNSYDDSRCNSFDDRNCRL